ncbi:hypothetical protein P4O66_010998, partial [Electrophorus voltai]
MVREEGGAGSRPLYRSHSGLHHLLPHKEQECFSDYITTDVLQHNAKGQSSPDFLCPLMSTDLLQDTRAPFWTYLSFWAHFGPHVGVMENYWPTYHPYPFQVNQKSGAQVNVLGNEEEQSSVCFLLQGTAEQLLLAKCSLEKLASDCRGAETLKLINRTSGARVTCPRDRGCSQQEKGKVTIMGTRQEVQRAKEMIMEKVLENETVRKRISQSSALRQKRKPPVPEPLHKVQGHEADILNGESLLSPLTEASLIHTSESHWFVSSGDHTAENSLKSDEEEIPSPASLLEVSKFEIPSPDLSFQPGEHLEVYVSASEHPQHFWIQIIGVRSLQLDKLTAEMSRFYNGDILHEHKVEAIVVGDILAAPYRDHGTWNRARVLGVLGSGLVDIYYVDFGDNAELPRDQLRSMRSDFLSLPFQAIECSLAGVLPAGETWTEEALDDFERMTYCAEWKPLLAKLCSYSHSELSSWPLVKLYDNSEGKVVDLGEELIRLGHAMSCQDEGGGLREGDEARSLQKMLDDMTGVTSELSLSCISLSGNHVIGSSSSAASPLDQSVFTPQSPVTSFGLLSGTGGRPERDLCLPASIPSLLSSSSSSSSSSSIDAVRAALDFVTLSDDVFLGSGGGSSSAATSSSRLVESESSHSRSEQSSSSIRGIWYYLSSSRDSTETSINTTMPASSSVSSSAYSADSSSMTGFQKENLREEEECEEALLIVEADNAVGIRGDST